MISACAGEGRDLLGVLADHPRAADVTARLVELDPELAATAAAHAPPGRRSRLRRRVDDERVRGRGSGRPGARVRRLRQRHRRRRRTTRCDRSPTLCAPGATVIWTRHRRPPDLTIDVRRWFAEAAFEEIAFIGSDDFLFGVGAHRLTGPPLPFAPGVKLFTFVGYDSLT